MEFMMMLSGPSRCNACREPFEEDEDMYLWEREFICEYCFETLFDELSAHEKAELAGCVIIKNRRPSRTPVNDH